MGKQSTTQHVERITFKTDQERSDSLAGILEASAGSSLYNSDPMISGTVTKLVKTGALIKPAADMVAADDAKLKIDTQALYGLRADFDGELDTLFTLVEKQAKTPADLISLSMKPRGKASTKPSLLPPDTVDLKMGKKGQGWFAASAHEVGKTRRHYAAQMSTDGGLTWTTVPGVWKSRKLTGVSGTQVWVRFALMLGQLQSEWGTAVQVTFP